jgi:hypothetical protein
MYSGQLGYSAFLSYAGAGINFRSSTSIRTGGGKDVYIWTQISFRTLRVFYLSPNQSLKYGSLGM